MGRSARLHARLPSIGNGFSYSVDKRLIFASQRSSFLIETPFCLVLIFLSAMATTTPLPTTSDDPAKEEAKEESSARKQPKNMRRTHSKELVDESHHNVIDEDPLMISQTLTYVTDDGSVLHSFQSAPFSFGFKARFIILETIFVLLVLFAVPIGAHGTVVVVSVANLLAVAWFWYNLVRSVDVTSDGTLRFWIGNIEIDIPFDKVVSIRRIATAGTPCTLYTSVWPYRGFLSNPSDGIAVVTTVPSTPFWLWPRSAGKPERSFCGFLMCPKLTVVFSPSCSSQTFIQDVENEMHNFQNGTGKRRKNAEAPGTSITARTNPDFLDV